MVAEFKDELTQRLKYWNGHSDTLGLFADPGFLRRAGTALAAPFADARVDKVAGIEARGFVLATAVALELGAGFVAVRKPGAVHPGPKAELQGPPDWRGKTTLLQLQRHVIEAGERVLIVDDWAETGSKATTARRLVETCGGHYVGLSHASPSPTKSWPRRRGASAACACHRTRSSPKNRPETERLGADVVCATPSCAHELGSALTA